MHNDQALKELLATFSERDALILINRYGLFGESSKTYKEIGKSFGITAPRVRQICAASLKKCKEYSRYHLLNKVKDPKLLHAISELN